MHWNHLEGLVKQTGPTPRVSDSEGLNRCNSNRFPGDENGDVVQGPLFDNHRASLKTGQREGRHRVAIKPGNIDNIISLCITMRCQHAIMHSPLFPDLVVTPGSGTAAAESRALLHDLIESSP